MWRDVLAHQRDIATAGEELAQFADVQTLIPAHIEYTGGDERDRGGRQIEAHNVANVKIRKDSLLNAPKQNDRFRADQGDFAGVLYNVEKVITMRPRGRAHEYKLICKELAV